MYYIILLLCIISPSYGQLDVDVPCNFTDLISRVNYTAATIAGRWYQSERIPNEFESGDCSTATFTAVMSNGLPKALEFSNKEVVNGSLVHRNATVHLSSTYFGVLNFTFTDGNSYDYVIVPVTPYEYESMVLYSCQNNGNGSLVWAWKMNKNTVQSPEAKNKTEELITSIDSLTNATWRITSFSDTSCKLNGGLAVNAGVYLVIALSSLFLIKGIC
ncbi:apolipoprotein D-like [Bicyclus anynana]|uniref:Apolipoprotein D-like n=1 Tax=Bicyclus anynana TaxID=110368 RepID=A0A6J1NY44_BICAN|nr:apolipoprotein D-like [Bicyclus anynana]